MKKVKKIIIVLLVIIIILPLSKDIIAKFILSRGIGAITGLHMSIEKLSLGLLDSTLDVKGLKILNPSKYEDRLMADVPELYIEYEPKALFKGRFHIKYLKLDLQEFIAIKNKEGKLNLREIRIVKNRKKKTQAKEQKEKTKNSRFKIDTLDLKIEKVIYKDYTKGDKPVIKEWEVNIDERYHDIDQPAALAKVIMVRALIYTTISNLTQFDLKSLEEGIGTILKGVSKLTTDAADAAKKAVKDSLGVGEKVIKDTVGEAKKILRIKD